MQASLSRNRPPGSVILWKNLVLSVAISAEGHICVARVAVRLKVSSIECVRELVVERMRGSIHVISFMTVLAVGRLVARLTLHAAERFVCVESRYDSVRVEKIAGMSLREKHFVSHVARRALLGYRLGLVAVEATDHSGYGRSLDQIRLQQRGVTVVALQSLGHVAFVREFLTVGRDPVQRGCLIDICVARAALVIIVYLVAIGAHVLVRQKIIESGITFLDAGMTVITDQLGVLNVKDVIEL